MFYLFRSVVLLFILLLCIQDLNGKDYYLTNLIYKGDVGELSLITDRSNEFIKYLSIRDPDTGESSVVSTDKIEEGIVLLKVKNYEVVKLKGNNFNLKYGGKLTLDYLYNGVTKKRKQETIKLSSSFVLFKDNTRIDSMRFIEKKVLGKTVGIKKIIFN